MADAPAGAGRVGTFAALGNRSFFFLWLGLVASFTSLTMQNLARAYLAYQLTGKAESVGQMLTAWGIPMVAFTLIAGVVADRLPKRNILFFTQGTLCISAFVLAGISALGIVEFWHLLVIGVVQGVAFGFNVPTRQSIVPEVVQGPMLANAIALIQSGNALAQIAGQPIAGFLIDTPQIGISGTLVLAATIYGLVILSLWQVPAKRPAPRAVQTSGLADAKAGLAYVFTHAALPILIAVHYIPWLVGQPVHQLMPVVGQRLFGATPSDVGQLLGWYAFGALGGSLLAATVAGSRYKGWLQIGAGIVWGVVLTLFGFATELIAASAALLVLGVVTQIFSALNAGTVLARTNPAFFGRVMSVSGLAGSLGPVAVWPWGIAVDQFGASSTLIGSGIIVTSVMALGWVLRPGVFAPEPRGMDRA